MKLKLKQKKLIVIASLIVLGIGTLTFSLNNKDKGSKTAKENETNELNQNEAGSQVSSFANQSTEEVGETKEESTEPKKEEFVLEVNSDSEVVDLITQYMNAKLEPSVEVLTPLVNDVSLIDVEAMERETKIIERYDNIKLHSTDTPKEGVSLVYAYHEVKILGIETPAPTATKFIVVKESEQSPRIYNGEISAETNEFIAELEQSDAYKEFIEGVDAKFEEALDKDEVLAEFFSKLNDSNQVSQTQESEDAAESEETSSEAEDQEPETQESEVNE